MNSLFEFVRSILLVLIISQELVHWRQVKEAERLNINT